MKPCGVSTCPEPIPDAAVLCPTHWHAVPSDLRRSLQKHAAMAQRQDARYDADAHRTETLKAISHATEAP